MMGFVLTDVEATAILLAVVVATAGATRVAVFGIEFSRPFVFLLGWLCAVAGGILVITAVSAVANGIRPLWSVDQLTAFVVAHDLPLAVIGAIGAVAAAAMEFLRPAPRSAASRMRAGSVGAAGEGLVAVALQRAAFDALHGVIVRGRGWSTEIDHLVRTPSSIVSIETKTFSGRIEGRPGDRQWVHRSGGRERWFLNPVRQNATHLDVLRRTLGPLDAPLRGLVVVAGTASIAEALRGCVVPVSDLVRVIEDEPSSSGRDLDRAWAMLQQIAVRGGDRGAHAAYVRRRWHRA